MPPDDLPPDVVPFDFATYCDACDAAREQNEYVPPDRVRRPADAPSDARGDRPGDDFNRRAGWADLLGRHGWAVHHTRGEATYWTRPGKDVRVGLSASTGHCTSEAGGDLLYVFSSSAAPFEPDAAYSKFAAYALLEHGGDFSAAAARLRQDGYGGEPAQPEAAFPRGHTLSDLPDDGIEPDHGYARNDDLRRLNVNVKWCWEGWFQFGVVNLLAAEGGLGKTRFVADLCRRVRHRLPWPDGTPTPEHDGPEVAMWVAADRNFGELVELSEAFGFGDRIGYSGTRDEPTGGITLEGMADFVKLDQKVKAARPLFLVVDTAGGATSANLSKQEEARRFFAPLSDIAVRRHCCVVVITHLNASKAVLGKRAEERVRVVTRLTAENREPETVRRLEVIKSNSLFPAPLGMRLGAAGNEYTADDVPPPPEPGFGGGPAGGRGDDPDRGPPTATRKCADWLLKLLESQPVRVSQVRTQAEQAGFSTATLYKAKELARLMETEEIGRAHV